MKSLSQTSTFVRKRKKTPYILAGVGIVTVAILGIFWYQWHFQTGIFTPAAIEPQPNQVNYREPTKEQLDTSAKVKEQVAEDAKSEQAPLPQTPAPIPVTITAVQPGATVYIRTLVDKITSTATCTLSMVGPEGKTYTASAEMQPMASTSTCKGFNVPMSSLSSGSWNITVTVKDGEATGTAQVEKAL